MDEINDLVGDLPPRDHNQPPLADLLIEETAPLKARADDLLAGSKLAVVTDRETAERATILVRMMTEHGAKIDAVRVERKAPYLADCRTIDSHFSQLRAELVGADAKRLGGAALRVKGLIDAFYDEEERKADAERRRLEDEARQKAEEAAAAERERLAAEDCAKQAALAGDVSGALAQSGGRIDAELRQRQFAEEARRLSERAAQTRVAPINTGLGVAAHRTTKYRAEITDWKLALRHALKLNEPAFKAIIQQIYDAQVKAKVRVLPGATVVEDRSTVIRRS